MIRKARREDVPAILAIEDESFRTDRLTRRKLLRLLAHGNAEFLVACSRTSGREEADGYALVLFRRGSASGRLYGIAVRSSRRNRGVGTRLLRAAEQAAARRGCVALRLEAAQDNATALRLYERRGYRRIASLPAYYEDLSPAWRYVKDLPQAK